MLKSLWNGLAELVAPRGCAACDAALEELDDAFCAACEPLVESSLACDEADVYARFQYGGPVADAIWRLKYEGRSEVARALGPALAQRALGWQSGVDLVTAVPITAAKLRARGYNQSALLAREVARALDRPFRPSVLRRVRAGPRQVGQGRVQRFRSIHGAFRASPSVRARAVLVIDDVRTTGATLAEAERALLECGASRVWRLVLAQADALTPPT